MLACASVREGTPTVGRLVVCHGDDLRSADDRGDRGWRDDQGRRILLCHRSPDHRWYPDVWDLPGGHIELGETPTEALKRELLEELGVSVHSLSQHPLDRVCTPEFEMDIWPVTGWNGTPANLVPEEHDAIAWFTPEELTSLEMAHDSYLALLRTVL